MVVVKVSGWSPLHQELHPLRSSLNRFRYSGEHLCVRILVLAANLSIHRMSLLLNPAKTACYIFLLHISGEMTIYAKKRY